MYQSKAPGGVQNINNARCQPEAHRGRYRCPGFYVILTWKASKDKWKATVNAPSVLSNPRSLMGPVQAMINVMLIRYITPCVSKRLKKEGVSRVSQLEGFKRQVDINCQCPICTKQSIRIKARNVFASMHSSPLGMGSKPIENLCCFMGNTMRLIIQIHTEPKLYPL